MFTTRSVLCAALIIFLLQSCNPFSPLPAAPTPDAQKTIDRAIRDTQKAETIIAYNVQLTVTAGAGAGEGKTLSPMPTYTLQPTYTTRFTFTPSKVTITVSVSTPCRMGPGDAYPIIGYLASGETAKVVGRTTYIDYWVIRLPYPSLSTCWLNGRSATMVGDTSSLPMYFPPSSSTPVASFTIDFLPGLVNCSLFGPSYYGVRFLIQNTGGIVWQSYSLVLYDLTRSITYTYIDDTFYDVTLPCEVTPSLGYLPPGYTGIVLNRTDMFDYDPTGHSMTAVFTLCSEDGLLGTCSGRTISFTP